MGKYGNGIDEDKWVKFKNRMEAMDKINGRYGHMGGEPRHTANGLNEHVGQMGDGGQVSNWTDVIMVI